MANTGFPAVAGLADGHQMALTHENIFMPPNQPRPMVMSAGNLIPVEVTTSPANEWTIPIVKKFMRGERVGQRRSAGLQEEGEHLARERYMAGGLQGANVEDPAIYARAGAAQRQQRERAAAGRNFQTARASNTVLSQWDQMGNIPAPAQRKRRI